MEYLSDEWIHALASAASTVTIERSPDDPVIVVQTVITDGSDDAVAYHLVLDGPTLAVRAGRSDHPTVVLTQSKPTAVDIASGRRSAQEAFMAGDVQVGGDVTALIEHREVIAAFDVVMASVGTETEF